MPVVCSYFAVPWEKRTERHKSASAASCWQLDMEKGHIFQKKEKEKEMIVQYKEWKTEA